jgi:nucleotidyltransferase/DNA polymerase involved in DNA repair
MSTISPMYKYFRGLCHKTRRASTSTQLTATELTSSAGIAPNPMLAKIAYILDYVTYMLSPL